MSRMSAVRGFKSWLWVLDTALCLVKEVIDMPAEIQTFLEIWLLSRSIPDADGDEMTAFRMMKPLHRQKMYVELLGRAECQALYLPWGCSSHQIHRGIISLLPNLPSRSWPRSRSWLQGCWWRKPMAASKRLAIFMRAASQAGNWRGLLKSLMHQSG